MKSSDRSINMITPVADEAYAEHEAAPIFVEAMAAAVSPVSIVTTNGPAGQFGLTVSAVTSVSADPPLALACINKKSPLLSAIRTNKFFCINMLSVGQGALADCFAGKPDKGAAYDFGAAAWHEAITGAPLLQDASASFDCRLENATDVGTHFILMGRVLKAVSSARPPLAYTSRTYQTLRPLE